MIPRDYDFPPQPIEDKEPTAWLKDAFSHFRDVMNTNAKFFYVPEISEKQHRAEPTLEADPIRTGCLQGQ